MPLRYPSHRLSAIERYVAETTTSAAAGNTIALTDRSLVRLDFSGNGTIDLEAGTEDGQYRILIAQTIAGTTRLENSATVQLNDRAWLPQHIGEAIGLLWNTTLSKWVEIWRSQQYDSTSGIFVKNETGSTIVRGRVVYISGATGNNPLITLADYASEQHSARTIGLVHNDIPHNGFGYVISSGLVENVNTGGMTSGQSLYLGASGAFTNVKPSAPNHMVKVGNVIRVSATVGSIQVWISNGWELEELHNVQISSPTNGQVLTYDSATSLWKNAASGGGGGGGTFGTTTVTFTPGDHSVITNIADTGVSAGSNIVLSVAIPSTRDVDEMEMAPVVAAVGSINAGSGFDVIAVSLDGDAEGDYTIKYTRN